MSTSKTSSLALKVGHSLKKCCTILTCDSTEKANEERWKSADDFLYLCDKEWCSEVSSAAHSTLTTKRMNNPQLLPLTEDIQKLNSFMTEEIDTCTKALKSDVRVSFTTLAGIIVFNRKRAAEAERMLTTEYKGT